MTEKEIHSTIKPIVMMFMQELMKNYWGPLYRYVKNNPHLIKTVPGLLLNHNKVVVYVGRKHIAVEYTGPEFIDELNPDGYMELQYHDYSKKDCNLLEKIVGFEYDSTSDIAMPLFPFSEDLLMPTNRGWDKLTELGWNFAAQNSIMGFNTPSPEPMEGKFTRIVNGMFFDADDSGLKTRRIKWLDFSQYFSMDQMSIRIVLVSISIRCKALLSLMRTIPIRCLLILNSFNFQKLTNSLKYGVVGIALNPKLHHFYLNLVTNSY